MLFRYCPVCGGSLKQELIKENEPERLRCSECSFIFYLDPKVVACTIFEIDGKIPLLQRAIEPQKGKWVIPGGYVDRGESVEDAAIRETYEECGIKIKIKELLGVYSYTGRLAVVIVYLGEVVSGTFTTGDECMDSRLIYPHEIPWDELAFRSTKDALMDYCRLKNIPFSYKRAILKNLKGDTV